MRISFAKQIIIFVITLRPQVRRGHLGDVARGVREHLLPPTWWLERAGRLWVGQGGGGGASPLSISGDLGVEYGLYV